MLIKTEGFVLKSTKYSETSRILKIYTKDKGIQSYIIKGLTNKKSKLYSALFLPLNILEIDAYNNPKKELNILKETKLAYHYKSIPFNIVKSSVILFLNEILYKSIKEEEKNIKLYEFIKTTLCYFDELEKNFNDFHLYFLIHLTKHLGFFPKNKKNTNEIFFNLNDGCYTNHPFNSRTMLNQEQSDLINNFCSKKITFFIANPLKRNTRNNFLESLVRYYSLHLHGFKEIKSLNVLKSIFT